MSRRDAALAFVAWEGGDPGSDYRKRPDGMAALAKPSLPERDIRTGRAEIEAGHGLRTTVEIRRLVDVRDRTAPRRRTSFEDFVVAVLSEDRPAAAQQNWRHRMSAPQWLGVILASAALTSALMAITAISIHEFMKAVERIWRF
ncbi:hypothetical protein ACRAWD_26110 [Caulobacter segnis]